MQIYDSERLLFAIKKIKERDPTFNFSQYLTECLEQLIGSSTDEESVYLQKILHAKREHEFACNKLKKKEEEYQAYLDFQKRKEQEQENLTKSAQEEIKKFEEEQKRLQDIKEFVHKNLEEYRKGYRGGLWATPTQFYSIKTAVNQP